MQWRVQEFVMGGGGRKSERLFFFFFQYFKGGPAQKIADNIIFQTKKVAKYIFFFCFSIYRGRGGGAGPLPPPPLDTRLPWTRACNV